LPPAVHGSAPPCAGTPLDFSVNGNPLGPAPNVVAAARAAPLERYPEPESATLRAAIAAQLDLPAERLVVGNGSVELIWLIALAFLERRDRALVVGPTFAEYARAARLMGARGTEYRAAADEGFRPDVGEICRAIETVRPRVTYVCNPNNPTGCYLARDQVEALLAATPGLLVLDEAYVAFADGAWDVQPLLENDRLIVLRSMTKDHALAGLRLGYALGAAAVVRAIQWAQPPWSVNAAAQAAGLAALAERDHVARGRSAAARARDYLTDGLRALGVVVLPSAANFFLVETADAATLAACLRHEGIYVRDCTSFGLPRHIRLAARPREECDALLTAYSRVLRGNPTAIGGRA
jgi:histidinol-phosphate aminotransferase